MSESEEAEYLAVSQEESMLQGWTLKQLKRQLIENQQNEEV
jgi:hypothetical protein